MDEKLSITKTKSQEIPSLLYSASKSDLENLNSSPVLSKVASGRIRLNSSTSVQSSEFESRAISFLKGISTGSPTISRKTSNQEPLSLVPCNQSVATSLPITSEEVLELKKVQAWVVASGAIKKSYSHCLFEVNPMAKAYGETIRLHLNPGKLSTHLKYKANLEFSNRSPGNGP